MGGHRGIHGMVTIQNKRWTNYRDVNALNVLNVLNLKGTKRTCFGHDLMILDAALELILIHQLSSKHNSRTNNMYHYTDGKCFPVCRHYTAFSHWLGIMLLHIFLQSGY